MNIAVRADSSIDIGSGHLMRCLTLADTLTEKGADVSFICRALPGNLCEYVEKKGYQAYRLPQIDSQNDLSGRTTAQADWLGVDWETDALQTIEILTDKQTDWLIVDHYAVDYRWEERIRPYVKKIMVIDDLADRKHDCDLLLDQNLYEDMENRYDELVPECCVKLLGPRYALLRREFIKARKNLKMRDGTVRRILVFFGGSDPTNETAKALEALLILNRPAIVVDVVVGSANPDKEKIKELCSTLPNTYYHCQVENMAELMAKADLAIGAGGSTTWERCCLGLPTIVISIACNQVAIANSVDQYGALSYLGSSSPTIINVLKNKLIQLISGKKSLMLMSKKGTYLVDGSGVEKIIRNLSN